MRTNILVLGCLLVAALAHAQTKNFLDQPYLETTARADTLVIPDRIYLGILIREADTKGRSTVEELEQQMVARLRAIGIDTRLQLTVSDLSSDFRKYFLRGQQVLKDKSFELLVYDAASAGQVLFELSRLGIANVNLSRTEYAAMETLQLSLKATAVRKAREQGRVMVDALGQALGKAIYISDSGYNVYPMLRNRPAAAPMVQSDEAEVYIPVDADFEKIRVEVNVQVKFVLE